MNVLRCLSAVAVSLSVGVLTACQQPDEVSSDEVGATDELGSLYVVTTHQVDMRDGVSLSTRVFTPKDASDENPYPVLLLRSPYPLDRYSTFETLAPSPDLVREGFIFVVQSVRGRGDSGGKFSFLVPPQPEDRVNEATDTFDTIEWIRLHVPNHNEKLGQWGFSYDGWLTVMGMIERHPMLVASSPQASPADMFIGDDWFHNGAFRMMHAFNWLSRNLADENNQGLDFDSFGFEDYLQLGTARRINDEVFNNSVREWREFMEHGTYDEYWQKRNVLDFIPTVDHAVLNVAGWFDAEDFYGPTSIYQVIESQREAGSDADTNFIVIGPWNHGAWYKEDGRSLHELDFGEPTSEYFRKNIQTPFFTCHLKDECDDALPQVALFETGRNKCANTQDFSCCRKRRRNYLRPTGAW